MSPVRRSMRVNWLKDEPALFRRVSTLSALAMSLQTKSRMAINTVRVDFRSAGEASYTLRHGVLRDGPRNGGQR